jgi:hypothetical protein
MDITEKLNSLENKRRTIVGEIAFLYQEEQDLKAELERNERLMVTTYLRCKKLADRYPFILSAFGKANPKDMIKLSKKPHKVLSKIKVSDLERVNTLLASNYRAFEVYCNRWWDAKEKLKDNLKKYKMKLQENKDICIKIKRLKKRMYGVK